MDFADIIFLTWVVFIIISIVCMTNKKKVESDTDQLYTEFEKFLDERSGK